MAKIIINRKWAWMNSFRKFDVYIDEQKAGAVKNNSAEEFTVAAGTHTIYCKLNWYSSNSYDVTVNDNDVIFLRVKNNMQYYWLLLLLFLAYPVTIWASGKFHFPIPKWFDNVPMIVLVVAVLYLIYYSSFGKKKYLWLGEDKSNIFNS